YINSVLGTRFRYPIDTFDILTSAISMTDIIIATRFHGVIMSYLLNGPVLGETSKMPRVSIGVPVYNGERYIAETLDSLLAQTFEDFELIISDNASHDRTEGICRAYAAKDSRIRYVRNSTNLGAARNYRLAVELSSGEYFRWANCDDLFAPTSLSRCVEVLDLE